MNEALGHRIAVARQNFNNTTEGSGRSTGIPIPAQGSGITRPTDTPTARYKPGGISTPASGVPTLVVGGSGSVASSSEGVTRVATSESERIGQMPNLEGEARRRALLAMQTTNSTAPGSSNPPTAFNQPAQQPTTNNLLGGNNLIYLLQDASGTPTALLVGPPGSAAQAPARPPVDMRWQPGGFAMPLGPDFGRIPHDFRAMGFPVPEVANGLNHHDIFNAGGFGFQDPHARAAVNRRNGNPMNIGQVLAGIRARAGHFWLAVRLAVFVLLFTGSGGWRRMLYLGSIAVLIFSMLLLFLLFTVELHANNTLLLLQSGKLVSLMNFSAPSQKSSTPLLPTLVSFHCPTPLLPRVPTPTSTSFLTNPWHETQMGTQLPLHRQQTC